MEDLRVILDAVQDGLPVGEDALIGRITAIGGIPEGTEGGLASVALVIEVKADPEAPDGHRRTKPLVVFAETTLALLNNATRALAARYPDDRP